MKTAISLPDDTFADVSRAADRLGLSRSEFFARAARRYLDELETASLTGRIDEALERVGREDDSRADAVAAGRRRLEATDEDW